MKTFFKEIYYYFLYGQMLGRGYSGMNKLNILLIYLEEVGIKSISRLNNIYSIYDIEIIFNDNSKFVFRCSNDKSLKWFGFMRSGKLEFSNGKILKLNSNMPSYEVLYKYKKILNEKIKESDDYTEYLPIRLLRKMKLKKIQKL